jgi:nucleoside 2-deoxyribosyltransferase
MNHLTNCFFAYPSYPPSLQEVMKETIKHINSRGTGIVSAQGWETLRVTGKLIINEVCKAIEHSDLFVCDLTFLNPNVLFELGYAVAKNKRVWISLDTSYKLSKANYQKLGLLSTVGYAEYNNAYQLANVFYQEEPYKDIESTLYKEMLESLVITAVKPPALFYLKCDVNTQASAQLSRRLEKSSVDLVVDDPAELSSQTH